MEGYFVNDIWAQAGIEIVFADPTSWSNTFANIGDPAEAPDEIRDPNDFQAIFNSAETNSIVNANDNILDMLLINKVPGAPTRSANSAGGLAFVGASGVTQYIGENLLGFEEGREVVASVVAHEIGHNLGLPHPDDPFEPSTWNMVDNGFNLMETGFFVQNGVPVVDDSRGQIINQNQIDTIFAQNASTQFITAVPEPGTIALIGIAAVGFSARRQRRAASPVSHEGN